MVIVIIIIIIKHNGGDVCNRILKVPTKVMRRGKGERGTKSSLYNFIKEEISGEKHK